MEGEPQQPVPAGRERSRTLPAACKELPEDELDTLVQVPLLNYTDRSTVLRHLDVALMEPLMAPSLCKALIMVRNSARLDSGLITAERPNLLVLCLKQLTTSSDALVRACAASCLVALASTAPGRQHLATPTCKVLCQLMAWLKEVIALGRDGLDVKLTLVALGSCCLLPAVRDRLVSEGAVQLTVGVVQASLPQLLLGQSKAGQDLTSGPYAAFKPMPYACHAGMGLLQNLLPAEMARTQAVQAGLIPLLEAVLVATAAQKRPSSSWLVRAQMLAGSVGIHHVLHSFTSHRAHEQSNKTAAAHIKAENRAARGLLAARRSPNRPRCMQALATPLAANLQVAVEVLSEAGSSPRQPSSCVKPGSREGAGGLAALAGKQLERGSLQQTEDGTPEDLVGSLEAMYGPPLALPLVEEAEAAGSLHRHKKHRHHKHKHWHKGDEGGSASEGHADGASSSGRRRHHRHKHKHKHHHEDEKEAATAGNEPPADGTWKL